MIRKRHTPEKYKWADKHYSNNYHRGCYQRHPMTWLYSKDVVEGDCFDLDINQGTRECEVVKVGRTRAEYKLWKCPMLE